METVQNTSLLLPEAWAVLQDFFLGQMSMLRLRHRRQDVCVHPWYATPQSMAYIGTGKQVELLKIFSEKWAVSKKPQCIMKRHSCWKAQSCHGCWWGASSRSGCGCRGASPQERCPALGAAVVLARGSQPEGTRRWPGWGGKGQPLQGMHSGSGRKLSLGKRTQGDMV